MVEKESSIGPDQSLQQGGSLPIRQGGPAADLVITVSAEGIDIHETHKHADGQQIRQALRMYRGLARARLVSLLPRMDLDDEAYNNLIGGQVKEAVTTLVNLIKTKTGSIVVDISLVEQELDGLLSHLQARPPDAKSA